MLIRTRPWHLLSLWTHLLWIFHRNGIIYCSFRVWPSSLSKTFSRFSHTCAGPDKDSLLDQIYSGSPGLSHYLNSWMCVFVPAGASAECPSGLGLLPPACQFHLSEGSHFLFLPVRRLNTWYSYLITSILALPTSFHPTLLFWVFFLSLYWDVNTRHH